MSLYYFGKPDAIFGKYFIDYCIVDIRKKHKLKNEEEKMIKNANIKYYTIWGANILIAIYNGRQIYRYGLKEMNMKDISVFKTFSMYLPFSICLFVYTAHYAYNCYYNDLKYLIKKYSSLEPNLYYDSIRSRDIMKNYGKKIDN